MKGRLFYTKIDVRWNTVTRINIVPEFTENNMQQMQHWTVKGKQQKDKECRPDLDLKTDLKFILSWKSITPIQFILGSLFVKISWLNWGFTVEKSLHHQQIFWGHLVSFLVLHTAIQCFDKDVILLNYCILVSSKQSIEPVINIPRPAIIFPSLQNMKYENVKYQLVELL